MLLLTLLTTRCLFHGICLAAKIHFWMPKDTREVLLIISEKVSSKGLKRRFCLRVLQTIVDQMLKWIKLTQLKYMNPLYSSRNDSSIIWTYQEHSFMAILVSYLSYVQKNFNRIYQANLLSFFILSINISFTFILYYSTVIISRR